MLILLAAIYEKSNIVNIHEFGMKHFEYANPFGILH